MFTSISRNCIQIPLDFLNMSCLCRAGMFDLGKAYPRSIPYLLQHTAESNRRDPGTAKKMDNFALGSGEE